MTLQDAKLKLWPIIMERAKTKVKAVNNGGSDDSKEISVLDCRYRKDGNGANMAAENCCFAGALIAPEQYSEVLEGDTIGYRQLSAIVVSQGIDLGSQQQNFLHRWLIQVQQVHDRYESDTWDARLADLDPNKSTL